MTRKLIPALATILLATAAGAAQAATASYQCSGGTRLTANFSPPGANNSHVVINSSDDGKVTLPQQLSADGGRYANGRMEFWIKGNSATLTRDGRSETCHTR